MDIQAADIGQNTLKDSLRWEMYNKLLPPPPSLGSGSISNVQKSTESMSVKYCTNSLQTISIEIMVKCNPPEKEFL